jgi:hypothetical protein
MVLYNLLDDGRSRSGPQLKPSKSMQGGTPDINPHQGKYNIKERKLHLQKVTSIYS